MKKVSLFDLNYKDLQNNNPEVAILPWGATEAHNYHLPYCTDVIEAEQTAIGSAKLALTKGANPIVLPPVPFGSNAQQLEQFCTIHLSVETVKSLLDDIVSSLKKQGIEKLIILNFHGGNEFKPLVRDIIEKYKVLLVVINAWKMIPETVEKIFDEPGDHAGELETSLLLHLAPEVVELGNMSIGDTIPFELTTLKQPGVWTPRPWNQSHPDTGAGNPAKATSEKGRLYMEALCETISEVISQVNDAKRGMLPFV